MVRISKTQIEEGIKVYRGLAEKKEDKLGVHLIDLLKVKPEGFSFEEISEELMKVNDLEEELPVQTKGFSLKNEIIERLNDMSYYGIVESQFTGKGRREYSLKQEYFLEED